MDITTEQELQQMMSELRGAFSGMPNATREAESGLKTFGKAAGKGAQDITKGLGGFALQVGKGDTSFKSLNAVIDVTAGALGGMAKALPVAGDAIAAGITAAAEAAKFMLDQMDQVTKGFNDMGSVGALTADGMTGLARQFTQSGLGLESFTKLVAGNSEALARMSGIAGDGAEVFSLAIGELTRGNDDSLRKLGMNADQIGETVGVFITQQTRLGRTQNMTATQLAQGAKQYALELDRLGKLTGLSREQIQKEQDAAQSDSRFRANTDEMRANNMGKQADAITNLKIRFGRFDKELAQGIMDLTSGVSNTDASRKLVNTTNGAAQDIIARLKSGEIDEAQANTEMVAALRVNKEKLMNYAQVVSDADAPYNKYYGVSDAINAEFKSNDQLAKEEQKKQLANTDDLTKSTIEAQKSMEGLSRSITTESLKLLPLAADATAAVTKQMNELAKYITDILGGKKNKAEQSTTTTGMDMGGAEIATAGPAQRTSDEMGLKGLPIKKGATSGGEHAESLTGLAQRIYKELGGEIVHFSGFNDGYARDKNSKHPAGRALDFTIKDAAQSARIAALVRGMPGVSYVQDEYLNPSPRSSGNHIHAEVSAANGAILSGPMSGYTPNLTMHGTEAIVPIDTPATNTASGTSNSSAMLEQLAKMEELASIFRSQLAVDQKLLSYSS